VPYEEVKWRRDVSPLDREEALLHKQMQVATLIRAYRARGHRIADLDPLTGRAGDAGRARPGDRTG
jgi:2-oxoglutarate dehydrogenase E1 component